MRGRGLRRAFAYLRGEAGQSIVEVALTLPIMAFTLLGGADMARAFSIQLAVQNGARAGAEGAALEAAATGAGAAEHARQEMARTPGLSVGTSCTASGSDWACGSATVTITFTKADLTSACTGAASTAVVGSASLATPCYVNARVRYTFSTLTPWPGLPRSFAFDRTSHYRRYQQ